MLPGNGVLAENCGSSLDSLKDEVKNSVLGPYKKIIVHQHFMLTQDLDN